MAYLTVGKENTNPIDIHYHDIGSGQPIILIHGWPLSERSWERQESTLAMAGFRVITYCRRGFGESSKPSVDYDYDSLAADLHSLIRHLDLKNAILVGFSMGTGEVARYLGTYGSGRIAKAVFISGILPALVKTENNPEGLDRSIFEDMIKQIVEDRPKFLTSFFKKFYSHGLLGLKDVSPEILQFSWMLGVMASPIATVKCIDSWAEDFRSDLAKIKVPCLVIHGTGDKILPIESTAHRLLDALPGCKYVEIEDAPHGLLMSHADEVNTTLLSFLNEHIEFTEKISDIRH